MYCISIFSCRNDLDIQGYIDYIQDSKNGLIKVNRENKKSYTIKLKPKELMVYNEMRHTSKSVSELKNEIEGLEYFQILIQDRSPNYASKEKASFYYAYKFQQDIYQIINADTIRPSIYLLEQGIQGLQSLSINIGFPIHRENDLKIFIDDRYGSFSSFEFNNEDILKIPKLNY